MKRIPPETIAKLKEEIAKGRTKKEAARELGISYFYAVQLTNRKWDTPAGYRKLPKELVRRIRRDVSNGMSRHAAADKYRISPSTVCDHTEDIPHGGRGNPGIRGETLDALRRMIANGYVKNVNHSRALSLKRYLPGVMSTQIGHERICYFEDRKEAACSAYVDSLGKVVDYADYASIKRAFGIDERAERRKRYALGKNRWF
jgi:transposase